MLSNILLFLNIGGPEMIVIIFVALLLFGGEKLPQIARGLGKGIRDFKDASEGVKREITNQINNYEEKRAEEPVNAPHVPEATFEHHLPEGPLTLEHHTEDQHDANTSAPAIHVEPAPNTIPYVENHVAENHVTTAEHAEVKPAEEIKTEPVKTTHE